MLSCFSWVQLFVTLWTVAHQAPLSMGFSRQEYWSGLPWPLPGDLSDPGVEPAPLMSPALADVFFFFFFLPLVPPGKPRQGVDSFCTFKQSWCSARAQQSAVSAGAREWGGSHVTVSPYLPVGWKAQLTLRRSVPPQDYSHPFTFNGMVNSWSSRSSYQPHRFLLGSWWLWLSDTFGFSSAFRSEYVHVQPFYSIIQ